MNAEGKMRVLVADDSPEICDIVEILLLGEGCEVLKAADGLQALQLADDTVDLYILDVVMPGLTGIQVCTHLRQKTTAPILFLTAKTQEQDKTMGFSAGGDDYLAKPFSYGELISRVKSLLRRYYVYKGKEESRRHLFTAGDLTVDTDCHQVTVDGRRVELTEIEFKMLLLMVQNRGRVYSAQTLYEQIWGEPYFYTANNTVMVHIRNLRKKLERDPQSPQYIQTAWGKGYYVV